MLFRQSVQSFLAHHIDGLYLISQRKFFTPRTGVAAFPPLISLQKFLCSAQKSYIVLGKDHHQTLRLLLSIFAVGFYIGQTVSQRQMHFPLWLQVTTQ